MITFELKGQKELIARLGGMPKSILAEVKEAIKEQTINVLNRAKQKVSGEVLRNRTGTLRRKINQRVEVTDKSIIGRVGIKLHYAAAHEFGCNKEGTTTVKAHTRRNLAQLKEATRFRKLKDGAKQKYYTKKHRGEGTIQVESHPRSWKMNLKEKKFLRGSLEELKPQIKAAIEAAVQRGINK